MSNWTRRGVLLAACAGMLGTPLASQGQQSQRKATLKQRLEKGLRVRSKEEMAFIDKVVRLVNTGKLPRNLVDRVFFYARRKAASKTGAKSRRPMVYFQPALTYLAARMKISL